MIVNVKTMKEIEANSGSSSSELMKTAGTAINSWLEKKYPKNTRILVLCGKGNNGGDALTAASVTENLSYCFLFVDGKPSSKEAKEVYSSGTFDTIDTVQLGSALKECDVVLDAVYGFGYHGELSDAVRDIFRTVNLSIKPVISIDINSGAEADTGRYDPDAIRSDVTLALDCYKPFHMLAKDHNLFKEKELLSLNLPHPETGSCLEMDEDTFFTHFKAKSPVSYKGSNGRTLIIGGSYGMAGALSLNIIGAKTLGASYIEVMCPDDIYNIMAVKHTTPVFTPFNRSDMHDLLMNSLPKASAAVFGSGAVRMENREELMNTLLQYSKVPVVIDAEGLRLLQHNTYILQRRFIKCPVILTPHIGEFADLSGISLFKLMEDRVTPAIRFAKEYHVYLVLKGPHTLVVSPDGKFYINQSGCQALAQAGSGDLLAGMIGAGLTFEKDVFTAVCMSVFMHGHIADVASKDHSMQNFDLLSYPSVMDSIFHKHGI